jgi:hypothetical protein
VKTIKLFQYTAVGLLALPLYAEAQLKPDISPKSMTVKTIRPDLQPTDMTLTADCRIVVSFRNNGPGTVPDANFSTSPPSNAGIQMYRNGAPWGGIVLGAMDPAKSLQPAGGMLTFNWFPGLKLAPGAHTVKIDVDNDNKVVESNEGNNSLTKQLSCNPPLPDLQPTDLTLSPDCHIVLTLRNNGPGAVPDAAYGPPPSSSGIQMYSDGQPWGGIILGGFDAAKQTKNAGGQATHPWFPGAANLKLSPGTHTVKVDVDNGNKVAESNEGNNQLTKQLSCAGKQTPPIFDKSGGVLRK